MSIRKNIVMAAVLIAGLLFILHSERSQKNNAPAVSTGKALLDETKASEISDIQIRRPSSTVTLVRKDSSWVISDLPNARLDTSVVSRMLQALIPIRTLNSIAENEREGEVSVYGLTEPELNVDFTVAGIKHQLHFGKRHAFTGRQYLQLDTDKTIYLVDGLMFEMLNKSADDLRNHKPLVLDPSAVTELTISPSFGTVKTLSKSPAGGWTYSDSEGQFPADAEFIERVLNGLARINVSGFIDEPSPDLLSRGLGSAVVVLKAGASNEASGPSSTTIQFGELDSDVPVSAIKQSGDNEPAVMNKSFFMKVSDGKTVYRLSHRNFGDLLKGAPAFRDRSPLRDLALNDIQDVHVTVRHVASEPAREFTLASEDRDGKQGWSLRSGPDIGGGVSEAADMRRIADWVSTLAKLRLVSFIEPGEEGHANLGLSEPALEIEIHRQSATARLVVANPVSQLDSAEGLESPPRYGAFQAGDGPLLPFILSHTDWEGINRDSAYFLPSDASGKSSDGNRK